MLVLTARPGRKIGIGQGIVLTIIAVRGKQVRLGFEAPAEVSILRHEAKKLKASDRLASLVPAEHGWE
jgi:carbon storage regulator